MKVVRLSVLWTGHLHAQRISPVLISVTGWVYPSAIVRPEGLLQWEIPMTHSGTEPATLRLVDKCLNQMRTAYPKVRNESSYTSAPTCTSRAGTSLTLHNTPSRLSTGTSLTLHNMPSRLLSPHSIRFGPGCPAKGARSGPLSAVVRNNRKCTSTPLHAFITWYLKKYKKQR
jgi:hypothetical protein